MPTNTTADFIANSRTPYDVVIHVANPGVADDAPLVVPRATVLAALKEGPLKAALTKSDNWSRFNAESSVEGLDSVIRFTRVAGGFLTAQLQPAFSLMLVFTADALVFSILGLGEPAGPANLLVEMRLVHSNER